MTKILDSKIPEGPIAEKWTNYKAHQKLVNPANKRRLDIIVGRYWFGWCFCCRFIGRNGIPCVQLLYSGFSAPCALYRCTRWY